MLVTHFVHNVWSMGVSYYFDHCLARVQDISISFGNHATVGIWMFISSLWGKSLETERRGYEIIYQIKANIVSSSKDMSSPSKRFLVGCCMFPSCWFGVKECVES